MKAFSLILSLFVLFTCLTSINGQESNWLNETKKLAMLQSTQIDVERILGPPVDVFELRIDEPFYIVEYETVLGSWAVRYSVGFCSPEQAEGYNVAKGTIVYALLQLGPKVYLKNSKLNLSEFEKSEPGDSSLTFFTSKERGLTLVVSTDGVLSEVRLFPRLGLKDLRCSHQKAAIEEKVFHRLAETMAIIRGE